MGVSETDEIVSGVEERWQTHLRLKLDQVKSKASSKWNFVLSLNKQINFTKENLELR